MPSHLSLAPAAVTNSVAGVNSGQPIRVLLADDHAIARRNVRLLLEGEDGLEVIAETSDLASLVRDVHGHAPHVLVLDLRLSGGSSIETIRRLRKQVPDTNLVVLTMDDDPVFAKGMLDAGAIGFVLKEMADSDLAAAIRSAARGETYVSPRIARRLQALAASNAEDALTLREMEVLRLIALGHTSVEVARKLQLSPRTVETHRARIHHKMGFATRADLVSYALRRHLLTA
jgi:two-component system response regulator NreC